MRDFFVTRAKAFGYAFAGWGYVLRTQRNAWIHAFASITVLLMSAWLQLPVRDWATIIIAISMVWMAEFINTALESVVDLASPRQHILAKIGKDVGAAAVLIASISSVLIGLLILGPPLWTRLSNMFHWVNR